MGVPQGSRRISAGLSCVAARELPPRIRNIPNTRHSMGFSPQVILTTERGRVILISAKLLVAVWTCR